MTLLFSTLLFRWYVFFFWGVGLWALSRVVGFPGAFLRFLFAYGIAYICEWSSARPGGWFPFGHYRYLPTTLSKEIWVGILPLMDSLSFSFLAVGALGVASLYNGRLLRDSLFLPWKDFYKVLAGGVLLFVMIDMVIDPVALRGGRWFLGQIYDYPEGGAYFGVTLSNFAGWGVTGFFIMTLWKILPAKPRENPKSPFLDRFIPVFLYGAVYLFNLSVALYLKEWGIAGADLILGGLVSALFLARRRLFPLSGIDRLV
jgi:putative membrane protein